MKLFALLLALCSGLSAASTPWGTLLGGANIRDAALVKRIEYSDPTIETYDSDDLEILHLQVLAADENAFRLTHRLRKDTDGGLAEELGAILASVIRPNPSFFLSQVEKLDATCSSFNVDVPGLEYVDRLAARGYELRMRRAAIAAVEAPTLAAVKSNCLAILSRSE